MNETLQEEGQRLLCGVVLAPTLPPRPAAAGPRGTLNTTVAQTQAGH